ncbi:MAG: tRNA pseudouridine(13) synthase TruD [Candidatus Woesearchaeota archaeon]
MYVLKLKPEDFIVDEIPLSNKADAESDGQYLILNVRKKNLTTKQAVLKVQRFYNVNDKDIGYAGMKDKNAVTTQYLSVKTARNDIPKSVPELIIEKAGRSKERINLGEHGGNAFTIVVRNLEKPLSIPKSVPNYFGEQRFSENNVDAGIAILKGNFKEAVDLISLNNQDKHRMTKVNDNPVMQLRELPRRQLSLLIGSVQSACFNHLLSKYVIEHDSDAKIIQNKAGALTYSNETLPEAKIPLPGFGVEPNEFDSEMDLWLKKHEITRRHFIIKALPGLSAEGGERNAIMEIKDISIGKLEKDDFHEGKHKQIVKFTLSPGSYATIAIEAMFSS